MISKNDSNEMHENLLKKHSDKLSKAAKELDRCYPQDDSYHERMLNTIFSVYSLVLSQFGDTMAAQEVFDSLKKLADSKPIKPVEDLPDKWIEIANVHDYHSDYPNLTRRVHLDGTVEYSDSSRALKITTASGTIWHSALVSKVVDKYIPIQFPYAASIVYVLCTDYHDPSVDNSDYEYVYVHGLFELGNKYIPVDKLYSDDGFEITKGSDIILSKCVKV